MLNSVVIQLSADGSALRNQRYSLEHELMRNSGWAGSYEQWRDVKESYRIIYNSRIGGDGASPMLQLHRLTENYLNEDSSNA